jgi:metal-sulfur cluster biosynthetic enzyme
MSESNQPLVWQAEETHPQLSAATKEALREVVDPEIGLNIIELGLVRDLVIEDDKANLTMIMTTPFCPYAPALLEMSRKKVAEVLQRTTTIELGMQMWDPSMMEEGTGADWGFF